MRKLATSPTSPRGSCGETGPSGIWALVHIIIPGSCWQSFILIGVIMTSFTPMQHWTSQAARAYYAPKRYSHDGRPIMYPFCYLFMIIVLVSHVFLVCSFINRHIISIHRSLLRPSQASHMRRIFATITDFVCFIIRKAIHVGHISFPSIVAFKHQFKTCAFL